MFIESACCSERLFCIITRLIIHIAISLIIMLAFPSVTVHFEFSFLCHRDTLFNLVFFQVVISDNFYFIEKEKLLLEIMTIKPIANIIGEIGFFVYSKVFLSCLFLIVICILKFYVNTILTI